MVPLNRSDSHSTYIPCMYQYVHIQKLIYLYIPVCTSLYNYILVHTCIYLSCKFHISYISPPITSWYIQSHTAMYSPFPREFPCLSTSWYRSVCQLSYRDSQVVSFLRKLAHTDLCYPMYQYIPPDNSV